MAVSSTLLDALPPAQRLALAYARTGVRNRLTGLFALDGRLAAIVRNSREPMLAQLRLAWWREQLSADLPASPRGEPLLEVLECWQDDRAILAGLADGWEGLIGEAPLPESAFERFAQARANAFAAIDDSTISGDALRMGRNLALADLTSRLSHPAEQEMVRSLAVRQDWTQTRLPPALRPLAMLHALAARNLAADRPAHVLDAVSVLTMIRVGLLGR